MNKNNSIQRSSAESNSIVGNSVKNNSLETIDITVLSEQAKFQLSETTGIENYFYEKLIEENHVVKN